MQIIRIYRKTGGLVQKFRPFHLSAEAMKTMEEQYPESKYLWLH